MSILQYLKNLFIFLALPALAMPFSTDMSPSSTVFEQFIGRDSRECICLFTYDEILSILDVLEYGCLDVYSNEELDKIDSLISFLARQGALSEEFNEKFSLESDIQELLGSNVLPSFSYCCNGMYTVTSAHFLKNSDAVLCKSWMKKKWDKTRKFVIEHKTEILIGAAVVIGTVVVIYVVVAASSSAAATGIAAAAVAAGAGATENSESFQNGHVYNQSKDFSHDDNWVSCDSQMIEKPAPITLQSAIQENISSFKEVIAEDRLLIEDFVLDTHPLESLSHETLGEKARQLGSLLAHQTLDAVAELTSVVPQLAEEVQELSEKISQNFLGKLSDDDRLTHVERYENAIALGHEKIDLLFSTNQALKYLPEMKEDPLVNFSVGVLPPPGTFIEISVDAHKLAEAGKLADRAGLTKAGRSLMKHGYREHSVFPKPVGKPAQINEHGQNVLESILNHPEKIIHERPHPDFGKVIDIAVPGKGGARFTSDGDMIGFLEP